MTTLQQIASCVEGYDPNALAVAQARDFIGRLVVPVRTVEKLGLRAALGRVLARDVVSTIDVPAADNSAMDGYALRGAELAADADDADADDDAAAATGVAAGPSGWASARRAARAWANPSLSVRLSSCSRR